MAEFLQLSLTGARVSATLDNLNYASADAPSSLNGTDPLTLRRAVRDGLRRRLAACGPIHRFTAADTVRRSD
jgi:hypothetical protein